MGSRNLITGWHRDTGSGVSRGYRVVPQSRARRTTAAALDAYGKRHPMVALTEADVTVPRRLMREHTARTGEKLSLTAYVIVCVARAVAEHPHLNVLERGHKLYLFDDVTVMTNVDRNPEGERIAEVLSVRAADKKTYRQVHDQIRAAQARSSEPAGALAGSQWVRFIPVPLLRAFFRFAAHDPRWAKRYGAVLVSNVGRFGSGPGWGVPPGGPTLAVTVGGIAERPVRVGEGLEPREHLCLTLSFDHDLIDGAPAAEFTNRFVALLASGDALRDMIAADDAVARDLPTPELGAGTLTDGPGGPP